MATTKRWDPLNMSAQSIRTNLLGEDKLKVMIPQYVPELF